MAISLDLRYRPDIQGLRAIAVLLVIFAHLPNFGKFDGGFVGVDIFFVISGYVIAGVLLKQLASKGNFVTKYLSFSWKRLLRLGPALFVTISIVTILAFTFALPSENQQINRAAIWSDFFSSNIFFLKNFNSYWNPELLRNPFLHTWSLGVEFQTYLFLPIILLPLFARGNLVLNQLKIRLIAVSFIAAISLALFGVMLFKTEPILGLEPAGIAFYSPFTRFWEFAFGTIAYFLVIFSDKVRFSRLITYIGSALILVGILSSHLMGTISLWVVPVALGTSMVLYAGSSNSNNSIKKILSNSVAIWIGNRSYSIYLWHWPLLMVAIWVMPGNIWVPFISIALAFLIATFSFRFLEQTRFAKSQIRKITLIAATSLMAILLPVSSSMATENATSSTLLYSKSVELPKASVSSAEVLDALQGCDVKELEIHCEYFSDKPEIVVIGDSLGYRLFPAVALAAKQAGFNASQLWTGGCSIEINSCPDFIYSYLASNHPAGIVISTNYDRESSVINGAEKASNLIPLCAEQTKKCPKHLEAIDKFRQDSLLGINQLLTFSDNLLVATPFPQQMTAPGNCTSPSLFTKISGGLKPCDLTTLEWQFERQGYYGEVIGEVGKQFREVSVWNPYEYLCAENYCPAVNGNNEVIMQDSVHWSWEASRFFFAPMSNFINNLIH